MDFIDASAILTATGQTLTLSVREMGTALLEIQGLVGTVVFEYTIDGTNWHLLTDTISSGTSTTSNGVYRFDVAGMVEIRARLSVLTSGTPTLIFHADDATGLSATGSSSTPSYSYQNITTNTTTTVKSGTGTLHSITINKLGASGNTATIYDNTAGSGTKIATIDIGNGLAGSNLLFDVAFSTGLTVVTASGSPLADITVTYK